MRIECMPTELGPLVESIATAFAPLATERGSTVVTDVRESIVANVDGGAIRQMVLNLLDNALKFGPREQTVRLIVDRVDTRARIAVEDQGPGIPVADRERIWSPYVRLRRERSLPYEGSGIGLAVVRELAILHGGSAYVEDAAAGGARFVVELPTLTASTSESSDYAVPKRDKAVVDAPGRRRAVPRARWRLTRDPDSANRP
jgi:signal transduction histidine kinase